MFPALRSAMRQNRLARNRDFGCTTNLRQIGMSLTMYAADYDDQLPDPGRWMDQLHARGIPDAVMHCPVAALANPAHFGYAYNKTLGGKKASILDPLMPTVFDSTLFGRNANSKFDSFPIGRHRGGGRTYHNVLHLDGHVQSISP